MKEYKRVPLTLTEPVIKSKVWRALADYPHYRVYRTGMIYNTETGRLLKRKKSKGYVSITLCSDTKPRLKTRVHRLVAYLWKKRKPDQTEVNHLDFDRSNNKVSNLEWATHQENQAHAGAAGKFKQPKTWLLGGKPPVYKNLPGKELYDLYMTGLTYKQVAEKYNVHTKTAYNNIILYMTQNNLLHNKGKRGPKKNT